MTEEALMLTLVERLGAAKGPDNDLNCQIALATGWTYHSSPHHGWFRPGDDLGSRHAYPTLYTASIDAALTLVPDGCGLSLDSGYSDDLVEGGHTYALSGRWQAQVYTPDNGSVAIEAATPALAICAAALWARAEQGMDGKEDNLP